MYGLNSNLYASFKQLKYESKFMEADWGVVQTKSW